jgi:hypothetical protein
MRLFLLVCVFLFSSQYANAGWWDCDADVESTGIWGYSYEGVVSTEVSADRRSDAQYKATRGGRHFVRRGFGGYEYVCSPGATSENGNSCEYRFTGRTIECKRQ